jgi:uncharacterized phage protein (TIGR01671 family)
MREILFRGKRIDNGEWVEGFYCFNPLMKRAEIYAFDNIRSYVYEVIPETIGQYIGLTDKNGKKIFEGDFIKHFNKFDKPDEYEIYQVKFNERTCSFEGRLHEKWSAQLCNYLGKHYEVIGNIHDNPELLKGGKQND